MDHPIVFTPNELLGVILAICAAIITISGALAVVAKVIERAKEPNKKQNDRIAALESEVNRINNRLRDGDDRFDADSKKLIELEHSMKETNKVVIKALQALTAHAIDGNNTDALKNSKEDLDEYILKKL